MRRLALAVLAAVLPAGAAAAEPAYFAFPGAVVLRGLGPVYGAAAGARRLWKGAELAAFKTFGEARAGGLLAAVPLGERGRLSAGFGLLEEADFKTTYAREYSQALVVRQVVEGHGFGLRYSFGPVAERMRFSAGYSYSSIRFGDYKTGSGTVIPFDKKDLHDVNTNALSVRLRTDLIPADKAPAPLTLDSGVTAILGRIGQSDLAWLDLGLSGSRRLGERWSVAYVAKARKTSILTPKSPAAVDGDCEAVADPGLAAQCRALERDLTAFIAENNRVGTAPPLGGSRGLRSFRELRFKAAHTALSGVEVAYRPLPGLPLELAAFYELGHAADRLGALYARSRHSIGTGLRFIYKGVPLRLEAAWGHEGSAVFLTLGRPW